MKKKWKYLASFILIIIMIIATCLLGTRPVKGIYINDIVDFNMVTYDSVKNRPFGEMAWITNANGWTYWHKAACIHTSSTNPTSGASVGLYLVDIKY